MSWRDLVPGEAGARAGIAGVDAQLVWADASGWRDFRGPGTHVPVIVELRSGKGKAAAFVAAVRDSGGRIAEVYGDESVTHCTAELSHEHLAEILRAASPHPLIRRFELSRPLVPLRPRPTPAPPSGIARTVRKRSLDGETLLGVIDSGCPFAHVDLRRPGTLSTRIAHLWLQDDASELQASGLGTMPGDFGYGIEFDRSRLDTIMIGHARGRTVEEAVCYEAAGMRGLRRRYQHGAAVLGLLAAPLPLTSRVGLKPGQSPSWQAVADEAGTADIVFVQLPSDAVQDSTSAGLARSLLDGLHYILSCASARTKRILVNISDGSSRGSHDGKSILESAMASLIEAEHARGRKLTLVVAAGNSFDEERHAQFDRLSNRAWQAVDLRVPPDCEMATQVVVRVPAGRRVELRVTPPGGRACVTRHGEAKAWLIDGHRTAAVVFPKTGVADSVEALITLAPTTRADRANTCAAFGDWQIAVRSPAGAAESVHLFITRNQTNAGALCRGKQARFVDKSIGGVYDPRRHSRALEDDPFPPMSPIRRRGSLNSLATGPSGNGILVVGGRFVNDSYPVPYSSTGPDVGSGARLTPDFLAPTELSRGSPGIISAGALSGQRIRVQGTSFAAPQAAREQAALDALLPGRSPDVASVSLRREGDRVRSWFD